MRARSDNSILIKKLNEYDFTKSGANLRCYEIIKIYESLDDFSRASPININYSDALTANYKNEFFCEKTNIILRDINFNGLDHSFISTYFRGQEFQGFNYFLACFSASIDFYGYSAKEFLTYNREKILPAVEKEARKKVITAALNYIDKNHAKIPETEIPYAAAFYLLHSGTENINLKDKILDFHVVFSDSSQKTLKNIISEIKSRELKYISTPTYSPDASENSNTLHKDYDQAALDLIIYHTNKLGLYHQIVSIEKKFHKFTYQWSEEDIEPVSTEIFKEIMYQKFGSNHGVGSRLIFPCWGKYRKLAIDAKISWANIFSPNLGYKDLMVLPCNFIKNNNNPVFHENKELAAWTHINIKDKNTSETEILELYNDLSLYLKELLDN